MKSKQKKIIALYFIFLIVSMPFIFGAETFYEYKQSLPESAPDVGVITPPGNQCQIKSDKSTQFVDKMTGETWSKIYKVTSTIKTMCDIGSLITTVLSAIDSVIGGCCYFTIIQYVCQLIAKVKDFWNQTIYRGFFSRLCCIINCQWCKGVNCLAGVQIQGKETGATKGDTASDKTSTDTSSDFDDEFVDTEAPKTDSTKSGDTAKSGATSGSDGKPKVTLADVGSSISMGLGKVYGSYQTEGGNVKAGGWSNYGSAEGVKGAIVAGWATSINPYDNIYIASFCLCLPAFLFNIQKLKTVYVAYNCCVDQACQLGVSTEPCDKVLAEGVCTFWKGGLVNLIWNVLTAMVTNLVFSIIYEWLGDLVIDFIPNECTVSLWDVLNLGLMVSSLSDGIDFSMDAIDLSDMSCEDIGIEPIVAVLDENENHEASASQNVDGYSTQLNTVDSNNDGVYDDIRVSENDPTTTVIQLYRDSGMVYVSDSNDFLFFSNTTGIQDMDLIFLEGKIIYIENGENFAKYDFTDYTISADGAHLENLGTQYSISYTGDGCIRVVETKDGETKDNCYTAGYNFKNEADLNILYGSMSESYRDVVLNGGTTFENYDTDLPTTSMFSDYLDLHGDTYTDSQSMLSFDTKTEGATVYTDERAADGTSMFGQVNDEGFTTTIEGKGTYEGASGTVKTKPPSSLHAKYSLYSLTKSLVGRYMGQWEQSIVAEMCEEEYDAAVPTAKQATKKRTSMNLNGGPTNQICKGEDVTIATTQIIDKYVCLNDVYKYNVMYSISACHEKVDYTLSLENCDENGCKPVEVKTGIVELGEKGSEEIAYTDLREFNYACLDTSDTRRLCVPYTGPTVGLNDDCESIYTPPVVEECNDVFDIYITKNGNNYEYIYGVKQCDQETYSIALRDGGDIDQDSLIDMGYGDKTSSGVKTTDKDFSVVCMETVSKIICKNFNNEETSISGSIGGEEDTETLFNPSVVKVPEDGFFTYDVSYDITPGKQMTYETYLIKGNSVKVIEENTISSQYEFNEFVAAGDYDQFCIETDDLEFGTSGKQCYDI